MMLEEKSFIAKAYNGEDADSSMTIDGASMKLKHNMHELMLTSNAVLADSLSITAGGASMPGMTITNTGIVNM